MNGTNSSLITLALLSICLIPACVPARQPETPTGPHFSVLTYNVNFGGPQPDLAVQAILASGADLACLQETTPAWERLLRDNLADTYPHMTFRHSPGAGGQAVLSKLPFKELAYGPTSAGWFPGWVIETETPVGPVQILNVHLRPALSDRGSVTPSAYVATKSVRLDEIRELYGRLGPARPAIVLGDFNESDSGRAVQWLLEQGMQDALRQFDRHTNTWRWQTSVYTFRNRFDHILSSADLHCYSARVIQEGASDHLPVVAVFGRPP